MIEKYTVKARSLQEFIEFMSQPWRGICHFSVTYWKWDLGLFGC
jgi:hypothetical protein